MHHRPVYGLDIETDTSHGLGDVPDPRVARVRTVALSMPAGDRTFTGPEPEMLGELDEVLRQLEPGILATWNGAAFDLPYLADRAEMWGLHLGLRLAADRHLRVRGEVLRGHAGAYRAGWYGHRHLDASRLYRTGRRPLLDVDDLLRSLGLRGAGRRGAGIGPADVPGTELTHKAIHAFAANDARLVRVMVAQRLPAAGRQVDRIVVAPETADRPVALASALRGRTRPPLSPAHPAVRAMLSAQR
jgi:hypothetical protein